MTEYLKNIGDAGLKDATDDSNSMLLQAKYRTMFLNHYINGLLAAIDEKDISPTVLDKIDMQSFVDCLLLGTASERCAGYFLLFVNFCRAY